LSLIERTLAAHSAGVPMNAGSDLGAATELIRTAFRTAELNIRVNLPQIPPPASIEIGARCEALMAELEPLADALRAEIRRRFLPV
jgi:formiminotetrahydrofolate cyclodeaminase